MQDMLQERQSVQCQGLLETWLCMIYRRVDSIIAVRFAVHIKELSGSYIVDTVIVALYYILITYILLIDINCALVKKNKMHVCISK